MPVADAKKAGWDAALDMCANIYIHRIYIYIPYIYTKHIYHIIMCVCVCVCVCVCACVCVCYSVREAAGREPRLVISKVHRISSPYSAFGGSPCTRTWSRGIGGTVRMTNLESTGAAFLLRAFAALVLLPSEFVSFFSFSENVWTQRTTPPRRHRRPRITTHPSFRAHSLIAMALPDLASSVTFYYYYCIPSY